MRSNRRNVGVTSGGTPGRSADRRMIPIAPSARRVRSAPTTGQIAGIVSREGGSPSVGGSRYGFERPGFDGTEAVGPPGCDADRAGRDGTEPGQFLPRWTARPQGLELATLRTSV